MRATRKVGRHYGCGHLWVLRKEGEVGNAFEFVEFHFFALGMRLLHLTRQIFWPHKLMQEAEVLCKQRSQAEATLAFTVLHCLQALAALAVV